MVTLCFLVLELKLLKTLQFVVYQTTACSVQQWLKTTWGLTSQLFTLRVSDLTHVHAKELNWFENWSNWCHKLPGKIAMCH